MATKTLQTRIINKHDTLANWNKDTAMILKAGEIGLARIETAKTDEWGNITKVPTYLMKVGDGKTPFSQLNWLAAPASDVYSYAKKPEAEFIAWVKGLVDVGDIDLSAYATIEFVNGEVSTINETIAALDEKVGTIEDTYATKIEAQGYADAKDDDIAAAKKAGDDAAAAVKTLEEGTVADHEGRIAELEAIDVATKEDAQGYANAKDGAIAAAKKAGDDAQDAIDAYIESNDAALDVVRTNAQKGVDDAATAQGDVDALAATVEGLETNIGNTYETKADAGNKLAEAKGYTDTLANGAVKANTDAIAKLNGSGEGSVTKTVNDAIDTFATNLSENGKVDTFAELVNYVAAHGTDVAGMLGDISENAAAIEALQNVGSEKNTIVTVKVNGTALTPDANRAVNVTVPTGALASKDKVAEADLATDLATKINAKAAQSDLNTAVGRIDGHDTAIEALQKDTHTHNNKELLDTYTQTEANLADAVAKKHKHDNQGVIDGITADKVTAWDKVSGKVDQSAYDTKMQAIDESIGSHAEDIADLDERVEAVETNAIFDGDTIIINCGTSTTVL